MFVLYAGGGLLSYHLGGSDKMWEFIAVNGGLAAFMLPFVFWWPEPE